MNEIKYRTLLNNISLIYEMFEQFLISVLIEKLNLKKGMYFKTAKEKFKEYGFNIEKSNYWNKIYELQKLVNVIKHADGNSKDELQKIRKDFFTPEKSMIKNSINDMTLNVEECDLEDYCINIMKFIDDMPNKFEKEE